jgi:hypothetical protein
MNLNATAPLRSFAMRSKGVTASSSPGGRTNNGFGHDGGDNGDENEDPLLFMKQQEEEEEMVQGLFERYGGGVGGSARRPGEGLFLNSSIMVSGLSANPLRMSGNEVDDVLGIQKKKNSKLLKNNNKNDDNNNVGRSLAENRELRFLGDDRGPNVIDEYHINTGQPIPSLSSKVKAFQNRTVDIDESVAARQPAYVFGTGNQFSNKNNNNNNEKKTYYSPSSGSWEAQNVEPQFRYGGGGGGLDAISVFPPGESMSARPLNNWRETKMKERAKEDPLQFRGV